MDVDRKTFATMCGTNVGVIGMNVKRRKLIVMDNGLIDTDNKINHTFMVKYQNKVQKKDPAKIREKLYKEVVETVKSERVEPVKKSTNRKKQNEEGEEIGNWDLRKKKADALKAELSVEKAKMENDKLAGKLIPIELTNSILAAYTRSIITVFENDMLNLASIYTDILASGDRKYLAEITGALNEKLDDSVNRSMEVAVQEIDNAVENYKEVRNRGERK